MIAMLDIVIFGFGLAVTTLVGTALTALIVAKNRALDAEDRAGAPSPAASQRRTTG